MQNEALKIGFLISKKRKSLQITQEAFAIYLGISRSSVANIEAGRQNMSINLLIKAAYLFNCSIIELVPKAKELFLDIDNCVLECLNKSALDVVKKMEKKKKNIEIEIESIKNKILNRI